LVIALKEYMSVIFERLPFSREFTQRLLRRYERLEGDTPFIHACKIAMGHRLPPRSKTDALLMRW